MNIKNAAICLMMFALIIGCGGQSNKDAKRLIGTWEGKDIGGNEVTYQLTFKQNGTFEFVSEDQKGEHNYTVNGPKLIFDKYYFYDEYSDFEEVGTKVADFYISSDGNELTIDFGVTVDGGGAVKLKKLSQNTEKVDKKVKQFIGTWVDEGGAYHYIFKSDETCENGAEIGDTERMPCKYRIVDSKLIVTFLMDVNGDAIDSMFFDYKFSSGGKELILQERLKRNLDKPGDKTQRLIGTWTWEENEENVITFRLNGTCGEEKEDDCKYKIVGSKLILNNKKYEWDNEKHDIVTLDQYEEDEVYYYKYSSDGNVLILENRLKKQ
jgi:hypothetical protein